MSRSTTNDSKGLYLRLISVALAVVLAGVAGWWAGHVSVKDEILISSGGEGLDAPEPEVLEPVIAVDAPPLFLHVPSLPVAGAAELDAEVAMAAQAGIHRYVVAAGAPWPGDGAAALALARHVAELDPRAAMLLRVNLNPPDAWRKAHPEACTADGQYALPASTLWLDASHAALATLSAAVEADPLAPHVSGYVLGALEHGNWILPNGFDPSPGNRDGFVRWLRRRYGDDAKLRSAWEDETVVLAEAAIPEAPDSGDMTRVFLEGAGVPAIRDFLRYTSESTADAIAALASRFREHTPDTEILAAYGFALELTANDAGHFALGLLLESDVDGFVSPISYVNRGPGGAGIFMGPVHSALDHGKSWYLVDDTRTGVMRDPATGEITRIKGIRAEDIFNVQRRNFAQALTAGLGLVWSDPLGEGRFHDPKQWELFGRMRVLYAEEWQSSAAIPEGEGEEAVDENQTHGPPQEESDAAELDEEILLNLEAEEELGFDEGKGRADALRTVPWAPLSMAVLTVVVDEESRFYQQCDESLNGWLLHGGAEAALRAGLATRFVLLQDVIDGRGDPSAVYFFLNAFRITPDARLRLHARLAEEHACAIWLYAPGYFGKGAGADQVGRTVGMTVKAEGAPEKAGSVYKLAGAWMDLDASFGASIPVAPLFHIDDEETDVLAEYRANGKVSAAMRYLEAGWTSVYVAEPSITAAVLRDILQILEQPITFFPGTRAFYDAMYSAFCPDGHCRWIAIHAKKGGERSVGLSAFYDVRDLFDSGIGWRQKERFVLPMQNGETRLLRLDPI